MSEKIDLSEFHNVLLGLLCEFDRICNKNNIKYSLSYGTLLGAIRHKGFIPWDDDVDIMMIRAEYEKFIKIAPSEIKSDFFLQTGTTEKLYPYAIARLRKNGTAMIYDKWEKSGIHQGIYIDICPVDYIPDNCLKRAFQKWGIIVCTIVRNTRNKEIFIRSLSRHIAINSIIFYLLNLLPKSFFAKLELFFVNMGNKKTTLKCGIICEGKILLSTPHDMLPFLTEYTENYIKVNFENHDFWAFKDNKKLLKLWYGDYKQLPPVEKRIMFHSPKYFSTTIGYKNFLENR